MNQTSIIIRPEEPRDHRAVEHLVREAFWNVYRPGCLEHYVLHCQRQDDTFIPELNFVMEENGRLIGQAIIIRSHVEADDGRTIPTLTLGPIGILPELQRSGYGKLLLDYTFDQATAFGGAVLFEGNIHFYGTCGCRPASEFGIRYKGLPEGADAGFFLCRILREGYFDGITGQYSPPPVYFVDENEAEVFDRDFPPKEKLTLPGQLF